MSNNNNYSQDEFGPTNFSIPNALNILQTPTPQELIFKKPGRGKSPDLDYVSAATVIRTINKVFGLRWSFEIVETRVVESADAYDKPVAPVVQTLGKMTVPGLGSRMQWGSQTITGGQAVQEHTFKGSASDAMKKCATMFLVHLDLADGGVKQGTAIVPEDIHPSDLAGFEQQAREPKISNRPEVIQPDEPGMAEEIIEEPNVAPQSTATAEVPVPKTSGVVDMPPAVKESIDSVGQQPGPKGTPAPTEVAKEETTAPAPTVATTWGEEDIANLKAHKERLGIVANEELNPYTIEFFNQDSATFQSLSPTTIKDFNHFLSGK